MEESIEENKITENEEHPKDLLNDNNENAKSKIIKKEKEKINLKGELCTVFESNKGYLNIRSSLPLNYLKKNIYDKINEEESCQTKISESYKFQKKINLLTINEENEKEEEKEPKKKKYNFYKNRINSSNNLVSYHFNMKEDEGEDNDDKTFLKFSNQKSATISGNLNNLELKLFIYQEEILDTNLILKTKKSLCSLNFIDIDLFLQYIAKGKNFYKKEEDNNDLMEGFCLQYQTFITPETLINKIISCFDFFYSQYLNKDKKINEEITEIEKENKTLSIRKASDSSNSEENKKIAFGLIDLLYIFINMHNTYYHNELSNEVITKIYNFLKKLNSIDEIKEKYIEKLELAEIELKEYEASIKKFEPIHKDLSKSKDKSFSSSEEFSSEDEEKPVKKAETTTKGFKLNMMEPKNKASFLNIYLDEKKLEKDKGEENLKEKRKNKSKNKKEEIDKPYEFDILKYKPQDIASELTRVSYALYSKIKIKEFLKGFFNGKDKYKSSPHICQIIKRFNTISSWVIEEILAYDHAEKRSQILLTFIKVCVFLKKMGNFDDFLSIMTGLTNYNINKLQKTWGHIHSSDMKQFRSFKKLLSFEDNWKNLRIEIEKKIEEKSFFIPYLGYYTKRITYLEEMGPYIKKNTSLINIEKIFEVYKVLKDFYKIRNVKNKYYCSDDNIKKELYILQCLEPSNEDFLIQTSNLLEPKFILSNKKLNVKRRTKTDINFLNNINKFDII